MKSLLWIPIYMLLDVVVTISAFGWFSPSWSFDPDAFFQSSPFAVPYTFSSSRFEFVVLLVPRLLLSAVILFRRVNHQHGGSVRLRYLVVFVAAATYCISLSKLLGFSDHTEQLHFIGVWVSVFWSILSGFLLPALLRSEQPAGYSNLTNSVESDLESGELSPTPKETRKLSNCQLIYKLIAYCRCAWRDMLVGSVFLLGFAVAGMLIPYYTAKMLHLTSQKSAWEDAKDTILVLCVLSAISSFFSGLRGCLLMRATCRVVRAIRRDFYSALLNLDIAFFDEANTGDLTSRLTSDCDQVAQTISTNVNVVLRYGFMMIGSVVVMFTTSWRLTLVTLIAMPLLAFSSQIYYNFSSEIAERLQKTSADSNQVAQEVLSTMRTVRSVACERKEKSRYEESLSKTFDVSCESARAFGLYCSVCELSTVLLRIAILLYGHYLVLSDQMQFEEILGFMFYQVLLGDTINEISWGISRLMGAVGASRKVFEIMSQKPQMPLDGTLKPSVRGSIQMRDVSFSYPTRPNNPILENFSLDVKAGETMALVGPSGGGKSSIVALLEHFYEPSHGSICLDGTAVKDIDNVFYHQKVALVAQEPILYNMSIRDNILYGCEEASEAEMRKAAQLANVEGFVAEFEAGFDTECGEKGVQMSGGQKQRIAIARALVRNPSVLILDEATSALDARSEAIVQKAIEQCAKDRTVIVIAHRLSTIRKADKIAVIEKGRLVQLGNHEDLMNDKDGIYFSMVSKQLEIV